MRALRLGLRDIRRQRVRYLLVGLSTLLGVLAVVGVGIAGTTAQDTLVAHEEQLHGRAASVATSVPFSDVGFAGITDLTARLNARIGPAAAHAGVLVDHSLSVGVDRALRTPEDLPVTWSSGSLNALFRLPVIAGSLPATDTYPPTLALNRSAADVLHATVGSTVFGADRPGQAPVAFTVSGIVADGADSARGYADLAVAHALLPRLLDSDSVQVRLQHPTAPAAASDLLAEVAEQAGLTLSEPLRRVDTVESVAEQLALLTGIFSICAGIVLLISAVGIANVGLATVAERSRELTIRQALGARPRDVFGQVIAASVLVGCAVAVVAVVAALVGVYAVLPALLPAEFALSTPAFPLTACLLGIGAALGTSVLGGALPAIAATRVPIATALRS